ncbi:hypothetical protein HK104_010090 [Borealophlyctis nickersoniae]|nr:hypothetical protein HK104_010090 [Borealophlyctis nickersoniae]
MASDSATSPQKTEPPKPPRKFLPRTLSGIQPTGVPHLGNYLGALTNWVRMQADPVGGQEGNVLPSHLYSIVDLHALTVPQEPAVLRKNVTDMAACFLACGIDPAKSILFRQSRVPQHSELAWLLFCRTPISWLSRMHQWKTKLQALQEASPNASAATAAAATINFTASVEGEEAGADGPQGLNVGLLAYPVLQAADILIYRATEVPIGEDQAQHMNLTATVARSFNSHYKKEVFPIPKGVYASTEAKRIMSIRTPTSKMSKSDASDASRINLDDTPDQIRSKIRRATVDEIRGITYEPQSRPGVANLLHICSALSGEEPEAIAKRFANKGNQEFKEYVSETVVESLKGKREELARLRKDPKHIEEILCAGEEKARKIADRTLKDVWKVIGLR